MLSNCMECI